MEKGKREGKATWSCSVLCLFPFCVILFRWRIGLPRLGKHLLEIAGRRDEAGQVRRFLNVYVNEEDIRFLGGPSYAFHDGDEVLLVPSIAGGAIASPGTSNTTDATLAFSSAGDSATGTGADATGGSASGATVFGGAGLGIGFGEVRW